MSKRNSTDQDNAASIEDGSASYAIALPKNASAPFVLSSPHSGSNYTKAFRRLSRLDARTLRMSEDCFVDELFGDAPDHGLPIISARFPRSYVDVNREPYELDPAMFTDKLPVFANTKSDRVRAGLGTVPRIVSTGLDIYDRKLVFADESARLEKFYMPYHSALSGLLDAAREQFGWAVLIDCHSMPSAHMGAQMAAMNHPSPTFGRRRNNARDAGNARDARNEGKPGNPDTDPDIVIGDRFGASCAPALSNRLETLFTDIGYRVARNTPYAGGYCTVRYGTPASGLHAVQIEVNRRLYMCERNLNKRGADFRRVRADIGRVIAELRSLDLAKDLAKDSESALPLAAE